MTINIKTNYHKKQNILITGDPVRVLCREGNIKESKQPVRRSQFCCLDVRCERNKNKATVLRARTCSQSHFRNRCRCYENSPMSVEILSTAARYKINAIELGGHLRSPELPLFDQSFIGNTTFFNLHKKRSKRMLLSCRRHYNIIRELLIILSRR